MANPRRLPVPLRRAGLGAALLKAAVMKAALLEAALREAALLKAALLKAALLYAAGLCAGCSGPPGAGRRLGDDLGGFQVSASEALNGCGAGALGSSPSFEFEIDLAREQSELFWGREGSARLDPALRFELNARINVQLSPSRASQPGCSIERADRIRGALQADASGEIVGFTALLEHGFEVAAGEQCSLDDRLAAGLPQLPCTIAYDLIGERWRAPEPVP